MAELKKDFSGAKMNKDMDERVLPSGQYRDANNIQISTSDGSNVGSLQSLLGNANVTPNLVSADYCKTVAAIDVPEQNNIYYFVYGGGWRGQQIPVGIPKKDYIIRYNTETKTTKFVFVDIYAASHTIAVNNDSSGKFYTITADSSWDHGIRKGMSITGTFNEPSSSDTQTIESTFGLTVTDIVYLGSNQWKISHDGANPYYSSANDVIKFTTERVLKFNPFKQITAVNYIDDMLFWTDNTNEPRKIHIERSIKGTGGLGPLSGWNSSLGINAQTSTSNVHVPIAQNNDNFHTRVVIRANALASVMVFAMTRTHTLPIDSREDHITVIKKSPLAPLELEMFTQPEGRVNDDEEGNPVFGTTTAMAFADANGVFEVGHQMTVDFQGDIDLRVGDVIMFTQDTTLAPDAFPAVKADVRAVVTAIPVNPGPSGPPNNITTGTFDITINSANVDLSNVDENFLCRVELEKPIFEYKFPRFSYRWKYQDGEYSTFAPWSEMAFVPGDFDYMPKKGFNLGMTNRLRYLKLRNYFPEFALIPEDVVEIDLLYKETNKPTVYTVKTISNQDGAPIWPDMKANYKARGEFEIKSEMIHAVVESKQILRPWDNVPRVAKAQEMTGNRLVYGNYKQNYTIDNSLRLDIQCASYTIEESALKDYEIAEASCKSLRTYQVGVVWSDKYGRETPVMVPKEGGSVTIPKAKSIKRNVISAKIIENVTAPSWAEYVSYYIKETSNEYYNLAMDRFYDAEDGNIWISFPSAERNKVAIDTYLYLKKQHDNAVAVTEKARYRVIAVENEAPLFIKAKKKSFGFETIEFNPNGLPEQGRKFVQVLETQFKATFGSTNDPVILDNLVLRVGGIDGSEIYVSESYEVVSIVKDGSWIKITIDEPFSDEVNPIAALNPSSEMKLEILQNKFEDKPEFDGRFFVKILKDLTLQEQLLSAYSTLVDYQVFDTMQVGYLSWHAGRDGDNSDCDDSWWCRWGSNHKGGSQYSTRNRFFIDDVSSYDGDCDWCNMERKNMNRGGVYNWPQNAGVGAAGANGYMDLSYAVFKYKHISTQGSKFSDPYDILKRPGCLFRFKQDPAQVVFRIDGLHGRMYSTKRVGQSARISGSGWKGFSDGGTWKNESTGNCLVPNTASGRSSWNYDYDGDDTDYGWHDNDCQRWSVRLKLDKMMGSGPNHTWQTGMAPMAKRDAITGELYALQPGDRYDAAVAAGTAANGTAYPVGYTEHNWYPITSDTGAELGPGNQLLPASLQASQPILGGAGHDYNYSPIYYSQYPSASSKKSTLLNGKETNNDHDLTIEFLEPNISSSGGSIETYSSSNPAIWETEPKEDVGLDIYYEASSKIPLHPDHRQNELLVPINSTFTWAGADYRVVNVNSVSGKDYLTRVSVTPNLATAIPHDQYLFFTRYDNSVVCLYVNNSGGAASGQGEIILTSGSNSINQVSNAFQPGRAPWHNPFRLGWNNCWAFGNGVESDRIRDDFNAPQIDNGVKASTTLATPYEEELRESGMIWSGIFNSTSGVNNLNQFIQAEPITKDLNPSHGPIQKLYARNTDTLAFCEDKVLRLLTNKDALFNADGNTNVTASNAVIGQATPIQGDYGISDNPESFAASPQGLFWCDQMRGQVLKLEGGTTIRVISDVGMKDYFNDELKTVNDIVGTFDEKKEEYNITMGTVTHPTQSFSTGPKITTNSRGEQVSALEGGGILFSPKTTLSWNDMGKGWVSFKSFGPELGISTNNEYYTFNKGEMYQHHVDKDLDGNSILPNNFYGVQGYSDVTLIFNDKPGSVKSFNTINYEGTQSRITQFTTVSSGGTNYTDKEYYNLNTKTGWYVDNIVTDLQDVDDVEFKNKEGKWFGTVKGVSTTLANLDEKEFSVQGLGAANSNTTGNPVTIGKIHVEPHTESASGNPKWDTTADSTDWTVVEAVAGVANHGSSVAAGSTVHTLTPMILNASNVYIYSGLALSAKDFSTPGATVTTTGSGSSIKYIHTANGGWNADAGIIKVEYSNNGIAADPGNTVKMEIFYSAFTMPASGDYEKYADVDNSNTLVHGGDIYRPSCVKVHHNTTRNANSQTYSVTQTDISGITETDISGFDVNGHDFQKSFKHQGQVIQGQSTMIAEYVVEVGNSAHLISRSNGEGAELIWHNHLASQPWTNYYTVFANSVYHTSSGNTSKIKKCTVQIHYSPPVGVNGLDPDPISGEGDFCAFLHCFELDWLARPIQTKTRNTTTANTLHAQFDTTSSTYNNLDLTTSAAGKVNVFVRDVAQNKYLDIKQSGDGFGTQTWLSAGVVKTNTIDVDSSLLLSIPITLPSAATTTSKTFEYWSSQSSGGEGSPVHLTLLPSMPIISAKKTFTQQSTISNTISIEDKADTTKIPTLAMSGITVLPNKEFKSENQKKVRVSFAYTAAANKKITLNRQPSDSDLGFGAKTVAVYRAEAAETTNIKILTSLATGITVGQSIKLEDDFARFSAISVTADAGDNATGFSLTDIAKMSVGMKCTWAAVEGDNPQVLTISGISGTTVTFTENFYAGVNYNSFSFDGPMPRNTTITGITAGGEGADFTTLTISNALTKAITTPAEYRISSGWSVGANLTAVMLETTSVSGDPAVVYKRNNEKVHVTGTVHFGSSGAAAQNISISPDFFTVTDI